MLCGSIHSWQFELLTALRKNKYRNPLYFSLNSNRWKFCFNFGLSILYSKNFQIFIDETIINHHLLTMKVNSPSQWSYKLYQASNHQQLPEGPESGTATLATSWRLMGCTWRRKWHHLKKLSAWIKWESHKYHISPNWRVYLLSNRDLHLHGSKWSSAIKCESKYSISALIIFFESQTVTYT